MHEQRLRVLVVGGGRIGAVHARNALMNRTDFALTAVVEPHPSAAFSAWAADAGVRVVPQIGDHLHDCDAVIVAVPTDHHQSVVTAAAAAGVQVFCEKPPAADLTTARAMLAACERAGVVFQLGFNRRFDHNFAALRQAIVNGSLGRVELVRITSRDPAPPSLEYVRQSGGLFMDMTIHDFDMARFLTGSAVTAVFARGGCLVDPRIAALGDIDTAVVTLEFADGAIGIIENSRRASYGYDQRAAVHGSTAAAETANDLPNSLILSDAAGVHTEKPLHFFLERYQESFVTELQRFAQAVRSGSPPAVGGHDGIEAMRIAAACALSVAEGRRVALSEIA